MRTLSLFLLTAAACTAAVTPPEQIQVPPGFKVELLREAGPREGSWICMTQDEQGRLYISPQGAIPESGFGKDSKWGGIWRATLSEETTKGTKDAKNAVDGAQPGTIRNPQSAIRNWEKVPVPVGDAMGMLWAFDSLYVSGMGPQGRGIYRCKSSQGDGNLDTATLFKAIPGGAGEHGAHAIVLGPDKKLYIVHGNSTGILDGLAPDSPYRHWGEDDLLPRLKDPVATFFDKLKAPYGCVYRTDADGTKWELFAGGFRNPYDIAFNPDGELFTYDSDMEWDRGLPWYRPTRILHVVPGGEYGFREGSAKWPAYFPDSLPAVADIGVGCPTGIAFYPASPDVGTDAKGWPEKYRRALFMHDWTYGRILAVTLHEKGASYTARNDLASYTYPRDAEANGDVEVFLSGKGMPVTDLEFLRDGSMVFTVGGRGTAAALYRVSYHGPAGPDGQPGRGEAGIGRPSGPSSPSSPEKRPSERILRPGDIDGLLKTEAAPNQNAPEAQRKSAGGAASEANRAERDSRPQVARRAAAEAAGNATTESPSAKASAPDGARENASGHASEGAHLRSILARMVTKDGQAEVTKGELDLWLRIAQTWADRRDPFALFWLLLMQQEYDGEYPENERMLMSMLLDEAETGPAFIAKTLPYAEQQAELSAAQQAELPKVLAIARIGPSDMQEKILKALQAYPLASLHDDLKLFKLRVLELSFARQGRPSEERVKAMMEELLAHYPVPPIPANAATPARNPAAGAPVDAPAWRLNRELCALLIWLSNPELGALNADLGKPAGAGAPRQPAKVPTPDPAQGKRGDSRPKSGSPETPLMFSAIWMAKTPLLTNNKSVSSIDKSGSSPDKSGSSPDKGASLTDKGGSFANEAGLWPHKAGLSPDKGCSFTNEADLWPDERGFFPNEACSFPNAADLLPDEAGLLPHESSLLPHESGLSVINTAPSPIKTSSLPPKMASSEQPMPSLLAETAPAAGKADTLPSEAPPAIAKPLNSLPSTLNSGLGPVPNPGADIFPGRKPAPFQTELGRQVIEKTLALMDAAPSQEEQVWYALCLRWAHGWTPELRVRYFRWFHEKAARYSGGNSFAKFVEAIRADAASRVPEADRAALAQWLRPVAAPVPAAALKPRAFVKAWTLPELEAALDKLKDRQPDLARGKDLYTQAQCAQCHLFRDAGGNVGPDLTAVAQRFGRHDILESITDPSKVVSEQYAMVTLTVLDGKGGTLDVSGLVKEETSATITILTDPLAGTTKNLYKNVVVKREKAALSTMPPGLLFTLTAEEVADLLALFGTK